MLFRSVSQSRYEPSRNSVFLANTLVCFPSFPRIILFQISLLLASDHSFSKICKSCIFCSKHFSVFYKCYFLYFPCSSECQYIPSNSIAKLCSGIYRSSSLPSSMLQSFLAIILCSSRKSFISFSGVDI